MTTWARWSLGASGRADPAKHEEGFLVGASTPVGRAIGLLAVAALVGFLAAAWGIWAQTPWWPQVLLGSAATSTVVLVAMWNPFLTVSVRALLANIGLISATLMPWGDRILGAH